MQELTSNNYIYLTYKYFLTSSVYLGHTKIKKNNNTSSSSSGNYRFFINLRNNYAIIDLTKTSYYFRFLTKFIFLCYLNKNMNFVICSNKKYLLNLLKKISKKEINLYFKIDLIFHFNELSNYNSVYSNLNDLKPSIIFSIFTCKLLSYKLNKICKQKGIANLALTDSIYLDNTVNLDEEFLMFVPGNDDSKIAVNTILNIVLKSILIGKLKKVNKLKKKLIILNW